MKKSLFSLVALFAFAESCLAVGTVEIVLSYKYDGVSHTDRLVLGIGGSQDVEYDTSSSSYSVGQFEWSIPTTSGVAWRFGTERGYGTYRIGRNAGSSAYRYPPTEGGYYGRLYFGETYQLDVSGDLYVAQHLTDVFVSSSKFDGKKITNMTDVDIAYGVGGSSTQIPKGGAVWVTGTTTRFGRDAWNTSWEVHSEQDWSKTFTPFTYSSGSYLVSYDFPQFANLIIYKPSTPPAIHTVAGALVYADMKDSSGTNLLYGASGQPLYSAKDIIDNFRVMTEWVFDSSHDGYTTAWINGECVCNSHSTSHIIDYVISATDNWRYDRATNCYQIDFTMQLQNKSGSSGYSVEQRCWIRDYSTYADAPADKRASASVTLGTLSTFRATINRSTGEKKIELLQ